MLFDSYTDMTFHMDGYGSYLWTDADDEMDYYFIAGGDFDSVIGGYRFLTGKAPMPPRWSFGFCQSKERYVDQAELISVATEYRRREIPLDLIILDWKSWPGELWGEKIFDTTRFPDPDRMTRILHEMGVRMMISIWPHMAPGGENHREMEEKGLLLLNRSTYDAFSPEARAVYWRQAEEGLFRHGVDAWWCDCTEPFEADWLDKPMKPEPEERQRINTSEGKIYLDARYLSAYSLLHSRGIYEGQRSASDRRVLNLTRSSYAGQQRYGTFTWSGDISANWETLKKQVAEGLSFMSSGCPYWTLDIGGFFVRDWMQWYGDGWYNDGPADPAYRELFLRWFQYGAFLPMMRVHGTDFAREIWRFGDKGDPVYDTLVSFVKLRYRLLPYIYALARRVTEDDYTMMRPLAADFPDDSRAHWVEDQFMLGPALMVCPVVEPGVKGRTVYLPPRCGWYDFWTGKRVPGGLFEAEAPLDRIPLFVRAGSILPLGPVVSHSGEVVADPFEVRVYPGEDAEFTLYDDDGETYAYERGAFAKRELKWSETARTLTVSGECFPGGVYGNDRLRAAIIEG
jgi:alpha-D-xyloside xylohydrolase